MEQVLHARYGEQAWIFQAAEVACHSLERAIKQLSGQQQVERNSRPSDGYQFPARTGPEILEDIRRTTPEQSGNGWPI